MLFVLTRYRLDLLWGRPLCISPKILGIFSVINETLKAKEKLEDTVLSNKWVTLSVLGESVPVWSEIWIS